MTTAVLITGCSGGPFSAGSARVASGEWGGEHVRLLVNDSGGTVEFDCGHGSLDAPLALDAQRRFDVRGTFVREGGPVPDSGGTRLPARYFGSTQGTTLELTLELDGGQRIGPFSLAFGQAARLVKCLAAASHSPPGASSG